MKIVDLFSGAGGLTFGFCYKKHGNSFVKNRKNEIIFANEFDNKASMAFRSNFPDIQLIEDDIANISAETLYNLNIDYNDVDVVIGGPPCQSYSTVGKRQYDKRAIMYHQYIRLLNILRPKLFVFENVTGLLTMKDNNGNPVIGEIRKLFSRIDEENFLSYNIHQKVLNSKFFGVPQSRERVFIIGIRNDLNPKRWEFPEGIYGEIPNKIPCLTVSDAISDLPTLNEGEIKTAYDHEAINDYQLLMRNKSDVIHDHIAGIYGDKIRTVIQNVIEGEGRAYINNLVNEGKLEEKYFLTSGYNNTYGRLWWNKPSTTITNSFGTPSALRCIHPRQNRALSTREAARLQSFPDWIRFYGNKYEKNSQVGNAVPPLLAIAIEKSIQSYFKKEGVI